MSAALLIIDMQNDFVLPDAPAVVSGAWATVPQVKEALDTARQTGLQVIYLVREYRADGSDVEAFRRPDFLAGQTFVVPGTAGCQIVDAISPAHGEVIVVKRRFSGFMQTELDLLLRRQGVEELVICGTQYPNCIRATAFDAICLDYRVTVLTDATSAASEAIAQANLVDLRNVGISCLSVSDWQAAITSH